MTVEILTSLVLTIPGVVLSSSSEGSGALLLAGPAAGIATYWAIFRYYRNTDKSHQFERDTIIESQPVRGGEEKIDHISKTRASDIDNANTGTYRQRVHRIR